MLILVWVAAIFVAVVMSYLLQIFFHEIGHLVAGLFTGWRLIYIQFFHIIITRDKRISLYRVPSTSCQCIMSPKSLDNESRLYTLGGLIANLTVTTFSFYCMLVTSEHPIPFIISMCFFASGIALLMVNGIPRINLICNDMACYLLMKDNDSSIRSHNSQFLIAEELSNGKSYSEICSNLFDIVPYTEINDITAYNILLDYYYHMDRDEFMAAKNALLRLTDFSKVSKNVLCTYKMELLYLHMVLSIYGCGTFVYTLLPHRDKEGQYLAENTIHGDVHAYRVNALHLAFSKIRECDFSGASETLKDSLLTLTNIPCIYSGEKLFCQDQLSAILNMIQRM